MLCKSMAAVEVASSTPAPACGWAAEHPFVHQHHTARPLETAPPMVFTLGAVVMWL